MEWEISGSVVLVTTVLVFGSLRITCEEVPARLVDKSKWHNGMGLER